MSENFVPDETENQKTVWDSSQTFSTEDQSIFYVDAAYTPENAGGHIYGYNAFSTGADAISAVTADTTTLLFAGGTSDYGKTIVSSSIEIGTSGDGYAIFKGSAETLDFDVDPSNPQSIDAAIASGAKIKTSNLGVDRRINKELDESITAKLTIKDSAEVLVSEEGAAAGHIWNRKSSELVIEKNAKVALYGEFQNKGTVTVSGTLELNAVGGLGMALGGSGTPAGDKTDKGMMYIDGGSVSYTGNTWISIGGYTSSAPGQRVKEDGSLLSISNKGTFTVKTVDTFRVYDGATMALAGLSTVDIEKELLNEGTVNVVGSTLKAGTITNKKTINVTGTSTLTGAIAGNGNTNFGAADSSVNATFNMTGLNGGFVAVANGSLDIYGTNEESSSEVIVVGGGWDHDPFANGVASGTLNITKDSTLYFNQIRIGDRNDAGNIHRVNIDGKALQRVDPVKEQGGTVWLRYNGELNVRAGGELTVRQISNGGVISVEAATVIVNGKVEAGSKASAGDRAGQISLTENSTMTVTGDFNLGFQDDELRNGELTVNNSTLTIDGVLKVGESDSADPDKTVAGHGVLKLVNTQKVTVGSITVSSGSSIELDYSSTLIFNTAFSNSGTITIDMTGVTATGIYKLVDSKNTDMTLADYGNVVFKDGADNGYTLSVIDNDLFVSNIDIGTLYVNRDWAGKGIGEEVEENSGKFYGINAFDNMDKIYSKVMSGGVARVELSSDVSFVKRDPKIDEYGFFFKDDVVIGSDGDTQRVISSNGQVDLVIVGADQSRGSGNAKPSITIEENIRIQSAGAVWFGYYLAGNGSTYPQYLGNYAADITLKGDVELTAGQAHIFGRGTVMTVAETGSVTVAKSDIQTRGAKLIVNGTGKDMASAQIQLNHQNVEGDTASYIEGEFYDTASAAWELNNTFVNVNTFFGINTAGDSSVSPDRASGIDATVTLNNSKLAVGTNLTMADSAKIILNSESVMTVGGDVKLGNAAAVSKGAEISISGGSSFEAVGTVTLKEGATGITVADSTLKAGSIANAGTITVSGTSSLTIGALTGVISIADGSVLTGTSVSGGTILSSGSITVNSEAFTGSAVTISGTLNITDVVLPSGTDSVTLLGSAVAASAITVNGSLVNNNSFVVDGVKYNVVNNGSSLTVSVDQVAPYVPMEFAGTPAVSQEAGSYNFTVGGFTVTGGEGGITYKVVVKNGDTVVAESNGLSFSLADIPTYDSISITLTASDQFGESTKLVIMDQAVNAVADYTAPVIGAYGISQQSGKDVYTFSVTVEATDNFGSDGLVIYYRYASTVEGLANAETLTVGELKLTAADAGKTYYYQMMAKDKAGNETAWTTEASFAVADVTDPTVTGSVIVQGADNYSFTVSADATDNVGVEKLVYRWAETEAGLSGEGVAITETLIVGEQTQSFYYQVQAFDKAGNASGWTTAEKVDVNDVTAPVITESSITRISGTYSFSVVVDGTDNFGVTERLYRFATTEDGLADSQWLSITTPLVLSAADAERTYYYQVMLKDAAGNESYSGAPTSFRVDQIPVEGEAIVIVPEVRTDESGKQYSKTEDVKGTVSKETDTVVKYQIANDIASQTSVALDGLGKGEKVKVTIYDESGKKLKTATVTANKNGQAVVKDFLAPSGKINMVVESTTRKGEVDYTMSVEQNYFKAASANSDLNSSFELLTDDASETVSGWVGYGDSVDTYRISTGDYAAALDLNFTSLESKVKISLRDENGKKIKSMTLTAKNYDRKSFSDILVDAGKTTYLYVESTSGKKNLSADYTLTTSKEEFVNATNDSMLNRTGAGVFVDGVSSNKGWVGYSDAADYFQFEITSAQSVGFDLADLTNGYKAGKQVKFALYDLKTNKKVSLSSVKNSSVDWITKKELDAGKYCAVVSISNEKKYRTDYSLNILANS